MKNPSLRRVALVALTRNPPPETYDYTPRNRKQRRTLARELRRAEKKAAGRR